ncbi:unnamed protein product [Oppiella nova]|uniref:Metalloendopeptidase n=1 Tax=Oppiella nova TaxID=334625 RepID=A0A7R9LY02_9ACAR|nr:unnamed protein product [Oppiella nova]CAG2167383.1 unnamed protein product [Oppiella nova]
MKEIENVSCIRFKVRTNQKDYLNIIKSKTSQTSVGRRGGAQAFNLNKSVMNKGSIMHRLLHALGLIHEHVRSDRDTYLNVYLNRVSPDVT